MHMFYSSRRGFTLIELLVAVLIIGILAAVALPQYQKAVEKSRAVEAVINLKKLREAQHVHFLEQGSATTELSGLDIEVNDGFYTYSCILSEYTVTDCYASRVDGKYPSFEITDRTLYCRGTSQDCKFFSTTGRDSYWTMEKIN